MALSDSEQRILDGLEFGLVRMPRCTSGRGHTFGPSVLRFAFVVAGISVYIAALHVSGGMGTAIAIVSYFLVAATIASVLPRV
jgi:hypothetical protein